MVPKLTLRHIYIERERDRETDRDRKRERENKRKESRREGDNVRAEIKQDYRLKCD